MAERVGKETLRLATTAGSEFCSLTQETRAWDSKDQSYRQQQVLKSCDCQQAGFLERNLGIGEKGSAGGRNPAPGLFRLNRQQLYVM